MVIVETSLFTRKVRDLLSDDEYRRLQLKLVEHPESGALIVGSGGLRKIRWRASGRGKSGGARVIYYWAVARDRVLMVALYGKNERSDLTREQLRALRKVVEGEYK